jgi:hypothetical protein
MQVNPQVLRRDDMASMQRVADPHSHAGSSHSSSGSSGSIHSSSGSADDAHEQYPSSWCPKSSAAAGLLSLAAAAQAQKAGDAEHGYASSSAGDNKDERPHKKRRPRPKTTELTPEQLTKMREINRLAAKRHRQQSRKRSQVVQTEVVKFTRDNQRLRDNVATLSSEITALRKAVLDLYGPNGPRAKFLAAQRLHQPPHSLSAGQGVYQQIA